MGSFKGNVFITYKPQDSSSRMSNIEYLATQEFNDNIIRLEGDISAVGGKLTHTVSAGKDAYILVAKIIPSGFVQAASSPFVIGGTQNVQNNHTEAKISRGASGSLAELDRVTVGMGTATQFVNAPNNGDSAGSGGSGYGCMTDGIFHSAIGAKATASQLIEIENTLDNGNCRSQMVVLEIDAGTSPRI